MLSASVVLLTAIDGHGQHSTGATTKTIHFQTHGPVSDVCKHIFGRSLTPTELVRLLSPLRPRTTITVNAFTPPPRLELFITHKTYASGPFRGYDLRKSGDKRIGILEGMTWDEDFPSQLKWHMLHGRLFHAASEPAKMDVLGISPLAKNDLHLRELGFTRLDETRDLDDATREFFHLMLNNPMVVELQKIAFQEQLGRALEKPTPEDKHDLLAPQYEILPFGKWSQP